jgi:hypothetical protein
LYGASEGSLYQAVRMGHLLSTKSSLVPLIDRLNRYPIGLADAAW